MIIITTQNQLVTCRAGCRRLVFKISTSSTTEQQHCLHQNFLHTQSVRVLSFLKLIVICTEEKDEKKYSQLVMHPTHHWQISEECQ